jgi:DNA-binding FadR family transcriptional regulator
VAKPTQVRAPKAGELIAGQLRRQIIRGTLEPGVVLPSETVLSGQFGVSKPTMREAFRILEAERLIEVRRGANGGARVQAPDTGAASRYAGALLQHRRATLSDVYAIRALLESKAAGMLAGPRRDAAVARLEELVGKEEAALGEGQDEAFHLAVVELTGSETLSLLVQMLYDIVETAVASASEIHRRLDDTDAQRARTHRSHIRLVEILKDGGEPAEAEGYWNRHLTTVGEFLLEDLHAETALDLLD